MLASSRAAAASSMVSKIPRFILLRFTIILAEYLNLPVRVYLRLTPITPVLFVFPKPVFLILFTRSTIRRLFRRLFPRSWSMWSTSLPGSHSPVAIKIATQCTRYPFLFINTILYPPFLQSVPASSPTFIRCAVFFFQKSFPLLGS